GVEDRLGARAVPEEQAKPAAAELRAKPMLMLLAERIALPELGRSRPLGNHLGRQLDNGRQKLCVRPIAVARRVLSLLAFDNLDQLDELVDEKGMGAD